MPVPLIEIFKTAKHISHILEVLDHGDFSLSLGDIEMSAAKSAFEAIPRTQDKRAQVWACIGHLTSAEHAYEHFILTGNQHATNMIRVARESDANVKRRFVLIVKAICYRYLNEAQLCKESMLSASKPVDSPLSKPGAVASLGYMVASLATGFLFAELTYLGVKKIGHAEYEYGIDNETLATLSKLMENQ